MHEGIAAPLLDLVHELSVTPRTLTGAGQIRIVGPNGMWRVRQELKHKASGRGTWQLTVFAPTGQRYFSYARLLATLTNTGAPPPLAKVPTPAIRNFDNASALEVAATLHIQAAARAYAQVGLRNETQALETRRHALLQELAAMNDDIKQAEERGEHLVYAHLSLLEQATAHRAAHAGVRVMVPMPTHLRTQPLGTHSITAAIASETLLTRAAVRAEATAVSSDPQSTAVDREAAKAVLRMPHHPLVTAVLNVPKTTAYLPLDGHKTLVVYTETISANHMRCLRKEFKPPWPQHVVEMVHERPVAAYDFYNDRRAQHYIGSVVVAKLLVREHGYVHAAVSIESIVSSTSTRGHGSRMFAFCKALCLTDAPLSYGYVFAQCLPLSFWSHVLDVNNEGRTLVHQMTMLFASYKIEEACIMRCKKFFSRLEDVVSPVKQAVEGPDVEPMML